MKNRDYKYLIENGFDVEIKSNRDGYSVAYLTRNGERWNNEREFFLNNKKSIEYTSSIMPNAQENSHFGKALFKLRMTVQEYKMRQVEKAQMNLDSPRSLVPGRFKILDLISF